MTDRHPQQQLRRAIGIFGLLVLPLGLAWLGLGLLHGDGALVGVGIIGTVFASFLLLEHRTSAERPAASLATRAALATNAAIAAGVSVEPVIGIAMTMSALIPAVLALAYVDRLVIRRLMLLGAITGTYAALAPSLLPWASQLGPPWSILLPTSTLVIAYAIFHVFLWNTSRQLTDTAHELSAAMALSREVAQTLDPQAVGRIIARHIATASGATDCALSTWDRDENRLLTYAYYPPERQAILDAAYDLAEFPATRAVLMNGSPYSVDVADPSSDSSEIGYLNTIGQRSLVIIPLVVRGESIGTVELTSDRSGAFSERDIALAELLAREAAVALENARLYDQIHHQAFRDALTGLANRVLFHDRVSHSLDRIRGGRRPQRAAVLFLDVDHFKLLNDRFGHARGDEVLQAIAERVRAVIRPGDTAARLGGDEFAILLEEVVDPTMAVMVAERLLVGLAAPIELGESSPRVGASIGIAMSNGDETADDLLRNADIAMYAAKAGGRGRVELFRPQLLAQAAARSELGARLRGAVDRDELRLDYQPIVELAHGTHDVVGLEALVRWHPAGDVVHPPIDFIAMAEETGEIIPIGRWVIEESCRRARGWQLAHGLPDLRINVNLSARQFADPELVFVVAASLHRSGLPPASLTLEITESTLMLRTEETLDRVRDLRALGVRLSIDDFGTGYSSLGYLQAFEVDELKIDRSFVSEASSIGNPMVLSRAIVELGRALGLEMVVEGVETEDQATWFASLGCHFAQGFLYSKPLDEAAVDAYLAAAATPGDSRRAAGSAHPRGRAGLRVVGDPSVERDANTA